MRHILVPTDCGEAARAAVEQAIELCEVFHGKITLLNVANMEKITEALTGLDAIGYLSHTMEASTMPNGYVPSFNVGEWKMAVQKRLEEWIEPEWRARALIVTAVEEGRPSRVIVEHAREHHVDLIVMGTHGRGPVAQFFLGSVAENVIRSAECPVLTVRGTKASTQSLSKLT